jgi:hypothetical protein
MPGIPNAGDAPLIRTDFSDEAAWEELLAAARTPSEDGFLANLHIVDEKGFEGLGTEQIGRSAANTEHAVLFVADQMTMAHPDRPLVCVDVFAPERMFRVVPSELWSAENNLSLANMDFEEFADAVGPDGIFRGF